MSEKFRSIPKYGAGGYIVLPECVLVEVPAGRFGSVRELSESLVEVGDDGNGNVVFPVGIYGLPICSSERRCDIHAFDFEAARKEKVNRKITLEIFTSKNEADITIRCYLYPEREAGLTREELLGQDYTCWHVVEAIAEFTGGTIVKPGEKTA